jgi:hypothetical protein
VRGEGGEEERGEGGRREGKEGTARGMGRGGV